MAPKVIKTFICLSVVLSLCVGVFERMFPQLLGSLSWLLSVSSWGIQHGFIWQLVTSAFLQISPDGITPLFLLNLFLSMYILWRIGSAIIYNRGQKHFLALFFGSALIASLIAFAMLMYYHSPLPYAGISPVIHALLFATILLYPDLQIMLFLTFPIRAKWLIVGILGSMLLIDLSNGSYIHFATNLGTIAYGYLYALLAWKYHSPFASLYTFEKALFRIRAKCETKFARKDESLQKYAPKSKIYDFKTGEILLKDEAFMDACLAKIAEKGKGALSWTERIRMNRIAKKKKS